MQESADVPEDSGEPLKGGPDCADCAPDCAHCAPDHEDSAIARGSIAESDTGDGVGSVWGTPEALPHNIALSSERDEIATKGHKVD